MVNRWISAGHAADHLVVTTLPPRSGHDLGDAIPIINDAIRILAKRTGVGLIDLADFTSSDDGRTWRSADLHIGDRLHYSEPVRDWIAAEMVTYINARITAGSSVGSGNVTISSLPPDFLRQFRQSAMNTFVS
jgi:hypothetical protein